VWEATAETDLGLTLLADVGALLRNLLYTVVLVEGGGWLARAWMSQLRKPPFQKAPLRT
jgi:hypothetical protein